MFAPSRYVSIFLSLPKLPFDNSLFFFNVLNEALGYTIDVEPVPGSNIFNSTIVVVPYTVPIFFILAWLATLIGVLVTGHPYHYIVKGAAVVLTGFAVGTQYMLFTSAKKVAPNFGFFATTSLGVGSSNPFPPFPSLPPPKKNQSFLTI